MKALEAACEPPRDASGRPLYAAFPYDTDKVFDGPAIPGFLPTGKPGIFGPPNRDLTMDVDARIEAIRADAGQQLTNTAAWTNFNSFTGHGGKVLFYNGVSHPWFSAWDTLDYWRRAEQANGPAWADSSRFYMVPGMGHCGGGMNSYDSFDLLGAVVDRVGMRIPRPASSVASRFEVKSLSSGSPHPQPGTSLPISRHRYRPAQRLRGIGRLIPRAAIQEQRSSLEAMARCWSERINFR